MAGITAMGTTYNLPNYTGVLFQLTPSDTPFFSAIGGLTSGGQTTGVQFEWEAFDLRSAAQNVALEGQVAPTAQERVRANITNVCQIHQEQISVSYTKLAAVGQKSGLNNDAQNPVRSELNWQTEQMLKQVKRDVEFSFINGIYNLPTDNTTKRSTRGMLTAVTTNKINAAGTVTFSAAVTAASGDTIAASANGYANGTQVWLTGQVTTTTLPEGTYYVVATATNTFKVSLTKGGVAVDIDADGTVNVYLAKTLAVDDLGGIMQSVFDNGGISEADTATLVCNSSPKRAISTAYANAYGKFFETSRTVGGVNVTTITTDFGILNVMLNRYMPQDKILVASLEQCTPVFLEVPDKGHMFAEPLAKTGASEQVQLYGEVGLAYGNEKAHGLLVGLAR